MTGKIESRLAELNITLPSPGAPGGNYVPFVVIDKMVYLSGQVTRVDGRLLHVGKVGGGLSIEEGQQAARVCALNLLSQLKAACGGDLDRVERCVRLTGYVNCTPDFGEQPTVINGASDLMVAVFGDAGRHARTALGVGSLPKGVACEVEAIFKLR
jgi:enamine deaminase RidA (YjgF/YER057c/UK114 family)